MHEQLYIKDITPQREIHGVFLVGAATLQQAKNGPFWKVELRDATGHVEAKIWSPLSQDVSALPAGSFIEITGRTSLYREQVQVSIDTLQILDAEQTAQLDMTRYVICSPHDVESMWQELEMLCKKELTYKPWKKFVFSVFKQEEICKAFKECPAAKSVHHAYRGGLLEHSLGVAKLAMSMADQYPELDRQVLLVGALFHDVGKIWEFSYGLVTDYSDAGRLLGHMALALEYLQPFLLKSGLEDAHMMHFKHLILSHHGTYEFGSVRVPQTAEAMLLHYIDNIDAKMAQCRHIFDDWQEGEVGWSEYQRTLERQMYKPEPTPQVQKTANKALATTTLMEAQCLSLLKA